MNQSKLFLDIFSAKSIFNIFRPWTPVEDQKLRKLILMHRVGEEIPWQRSWFAFLFSLILFIFKIFVALYMPGRSKLNCEYRYTRSLSEKVRHGRWTEAEDIVGFG